jgi:LemA protein
MNTSFWKKPWIIVLIILVIIVIWGIAKYNNFASLNQQVQSSFATIDTQLQRRYDLIPNLVSTVKGNTQQEKEVFTALANARTQYGQAVTPEAKLQAAGQVESALSRLLVISENYPELQSSQAFRDLMASLEGTENRIAVARRDYNLAVQTFNSMRARFPGNIVGAIFGFKAQTYFEAAEDAVKVPEVNFGN